MRIGIVSYWFNRGQATVMRTVRLALDQLGHDTRVFARPTTANFARPGFVDRTGVWAQDGVESASGFEISGAELVDWARRHDLDAVLFFQNLEFDAIDELRESGVSTGGTFMWEAFSATNAALARSVHDVIYSLNDASTRRYRELGITDPFEVPFCASPALAERSAPQRAPGGTRFMFMAGYLSARKPLGVVLDAFSAGAAPDATLTVKAQTGVRPGDLIRPREVDELSRRYRDHTGSSVEAVAVDPRIRVVVDDLGEDAFVGEMLAHDVVVGVSRWEGLGLHLFECDALGLPLILNDMPPFDDWVAAGGNAHLVASNVIGRNAVGIDVHEPDFDSLADAFAALSRPRWHDRMPGRRSHPPQWERFRTACGALAERLCR